MGVLLDLMDIAAIIVVLILAIAFIKVSKEKFHLEDREKELLKENKILKAKVNKLEEQLEEE